MKAILCTAFGPPEALKYEEIASPHAGKGQVVVSVQACSVSFPDTLIIQGLYQFKPQMPFSPGGEIAGIVKEVGEGVEQLQVGDRVMGFNGWGGFAEEMVLDANRVLPMPAQMDFATAATVIMTYGTSQYALKNRGQLLPGETLLVLGASGGVGLAALQIGKIMGARVIAAASSDEKLAICKQHGADELINYSREDLKERVKVLGGKKGIDVIYDPVGGSYAEAALRGMGWGGRYLVIGFTAGEIPRIPLNLTLLKGCSIVGVFWGAFTEREPQRNREYLQELLGWFEEGKIKTYISTTYPLARAADALNDMMQRKVIGKAVVLTAE